VPTLQPVVRDDQLLEMSPSEAIAFGFSKGIVSDEGDLRARYGLGSLLHVNPLWSESLAHWLTSIYVRGFLLVVIFLAADVEFHTPGVGLPGLVALIGLAIFVGAPYVTGLANVWEIVLILAGLLLMCLELFVIPGFGVAGISGVMMVLTGLIATFIPDEPGRQFPQLFPALPTTLHGLKLAVATLVSSMVASLIGMLMLSRFLPRVPIFNKLVSANPTPSQVAVEDGYRGMARVGDVGQAEGTLRPAGKARFGSVLVDVVTEGEYLEADCTIEVIEHRGNRVVVRAARR
ncbi:MAG: NfeD family protein, partial [Planctomycetota bacterium]